MAGRRTYHVSPSGHGDWKVQLENTAVPVSVHANKQDAVERARLIAKIDGLAQIVVHGRDGRIQAEYTYGSDPFPPKG